MAFDYETKSAIYSTLEKDCTHRNKVVKDVLVTAVTVGSNYGKQKLLPLPKQQLYKYEMCCRCG